MIKYTILFISLFLLTGFAYGQTCDCAKNFEWVKKTFEENDAGFQYVIDIKGKAAYDNHNKIFLKKVNSIKTSEECTQTLYSWLRFFRAGHIAIRRSGNDNSTPQQTAKPKPVEKWETLNVDVPGFEKYLDSKKEPDFEGIWETKPYKIGIKKSGDSYLGFIIETSAEGWKPGQVKLKFTDQKGTFYLRDRTGEEFDNIEAIGRNYLQLGRFTLKRLSPAFETEKPIESFFRSMAAEEPYFEKLNETTVLLRIPSFDGSQKEYIDSVILANEAKICKTENLIIDLRNNGGGSDDSYSELIPFIYTNPIREDGVEFLSTKLNNQRMLDFITKPEYEMDEGTKKWAKTSYDSLEKHLGEFVNLESTRVSTEEYDTIYPYPKNVGILINGANGSTTEQFLLAAKQSKKVKLFGTSTFGSLDISNMNFVKSPCGEFDLGYCLSKSFRIPDMTIDGKGIQPDFYLGDEIRDYEWIDYVTKILNQK
ncbi:MAG: peptidase [Bacteroidetes bacterium]|jgi:hypothetical protein|nr:peptidase [Bacteroidota bacterium]